MAHAWQRDVTEALEHGGAWRQGDGGVGDVGSLDAAAAGVVGGFYGDGGCGAWCESGRMHGASWVLFV